MGFICAVWRPCLSSGRRIGMRGNGATELEADQEPQDTEQWSQSRANRLGMGGKKPTGTSRMSTYTARDGEFGQSF